MNFIRKYINNDSFKSDILNLTNLNHYISSINNDDKIYFKPKSFAIEYEVTQNLIDTAQPLFNNKLSLISRCDLFKSIKIDGEEIDLSDKVREPYVFKTTSHNDLTLELSSLVITENGFNEKYVLAKHFDTPSKGIIELVWNDNITTLMGVMMFNACITSFPTNLFIGSKPNNLMSMFASCSSLKKLDLSKLNTSETIDMFSMFGNCNNLTELHISNFNTSKVENMNSMFMSCENLTAIDLSHFDTSKTINMYSMFLNCHKLKEINLSNANTIKVIDMERMFYNCDNLEKLYLNNFDISSIVDSDSMFHNCNSLNYIKCKQAFKDWCLTNQDKIELPTVMREGGSGTWEIIG